LKEQGVLCDAAFPLLSSFKCSDNKNGCRHSDWPVDAI